MRLRHGAESIPGKAAPDPELRLQEARLYVITPDAEPERIIEVAAAAVRGGADVLQLRHKTLPRGLLLELARELRRLLRDQLFIVNDHVDIALLSGADGVHLGPDDISLEAARTIAGPRLLIGVSASTVDAARGAFAADYFGSGPAFATPIKTNKKVIGPRGIADISSAVQPKPVFAVGGIDERNVAELTSIGIRRVCVIRAVAESADPEQAVRRLRGMLTS